MLFNPVVISVIIMTVLSLLKLHVVLALLIAAIAGGLISGIPLGDTMGILVGGMGGNAETALSYFLLGALATAIAKTGAADILALKVAKVIKGKKMVLLIVFAVIAMLSGTVVPVHIAFIPILIPPLLGIMNKLKLDRRAAASALAFGLKAPYITIPIGYGLIYHNIIKDQMGLSGVNINTFDVWKSTWVAGLAMLVGFIISLIVYRKPREYNMTNVALAEEASTLDENGIIKIEGKHYITLLAALGALIIQVVYGSMPLGAITGLLIMIVFRAIKWSDIDEVMYGGIKLMGLIAFVMLVAAGYAAVMRETGGIDTLVDTATGMMGNSQLLAATLMILIGLVITMGIGTSFGTVPIIAAIYTPLATSLGFSISATILLIATAAALGDAGSPASDTTLGPTAGLNADGQHDHIWDTCVPTFLSYNIPLIIFGIIGAVLL